MLIVKNFRKKRSSTKTCSIDTLKPRLLFLREGTYEIGKGQPESSRPLDCTLCRPCSPVSGWQEQKRRTELTVWVIGSRCRPGMFSGYHFFPNTLRYVNDSMSLRTLTYPGWTAGYPSLTANETAICSGIFRIFLTSFCTGPLNALMI